MHSGGRTHSSLAHRPLGGTHRLIDSQLTVISDHWDDAAEVAQLTELDRQHLWGRQILNPFIRYGYPPSG